MKNETPRTTALIADIVQNPGLEWTRAEVEQLGEHAFQLERELNQWREIADDFAKNCGVLGRYKAAKHLDMIDKYKRMAAMPNVES